MPANVMSTYNSLQDELEQAKGGLYKLDENLKKIVQTSGRYKQDRLLGKQNGPSLFPNAKRFNENNNSFSNNRKSTNETKIVFSRLSRKVGGDSDIEDDTKEQNIKTRISSQVTRTLPTKQEVLRAQLNSDPGNKKDNAEVCRARRVFGSLIGTLRAFCKEEALARDKDGFAKRVSVEQRIEGKASVEAAEMANQRRSLIQQREQQIQRIKMIELQMHRVRCHEDWEKSQKHLAGFIKTSAKPCLYWSPSKHTDKTKQLLGSSQHQLKRTIDKRRRELEADLEVINNKRMTKDKTEENKDEKQVEQTNLNMEIKDRINITNEEVKIPKVEKMEIEETVTNQENEVPQQTEESEQTLTKESSVEKQEPE